MKHWFIAICLLIFFSCSKKSGSSLPSVSLNNVLQSRVDTNSVFRFNLSLNAPASKQITVHYATKDGTAVANKDYIPASGSVTINAGQSQAYVDITVTGDSLRQPYQEFYLDFSNPVNCTLVSDEAIATITK